MFSLRIQKSIQKPSKFGFKNPWKFEHHLCQLKMNMLHFWSQKAIKMRSKILENQVRSGHLSSGHVFGRWALSPRPVWRGRGTKRYSRMCPPLKRPFVTFDRGGQTGPPRSNVFFSAPLTTRAPPGRPAGRLAERPAGRPAGRPARLPAGRPAQRLTLWCASPFLNGRIAFSTIFKRTENRKDSSAFDDFWTKSIVSPRSSFRIIERTKKRNKKRHKNEKEKSNMRKYSDGLLCLYLKMPQSYPPGASQGTQAAAEQRLITRERTVDHNLY